MITEQEDRAEPKPPTLRDRVLARFVRKPGESKKVVRAAMLAAQLNEHRLVTELQLLILVAEGQLVRLDPESDLAEPLYTDPSRP
jgi:hypothetical protein